MIVKIDKIIYPGRRLARKEGKVIFTDLGLPGETVEVEIIKEKTSYSEARTLKIIDKAPHRTVTKCGHYQICSSYQEIDYSFQLEIKKDQLKEIFKRELRIELADIEILPSPKIWGYRNKISLKVNWTESGLDFVYHEPGQVEQFLSVEECWLVPEKINQLLKAIRNLIRKNQIISWTGLEIKTSQFQDKILLIFKLEADHRIIEIKPLALELGQNFNLAGAVALTKAGKQLKETIITGDNYLEENVSGLKFQYGASTFFQINMALLEKVIAEIQTLLGQNPDKTVADMYCGPGTFGLSLAKNVAEVIGVEIDPANIFYLKKNIKLNSIHNVAVCPGSSEDWVRKVLQQRVDVVILDPPRCGLTKQIIEALNNNPGPEIFYLSCNPSTLVRDIKNLSPAYELRKIKAFDFFAQTPHIEVLAVLSTS